MPIVERETTTYKTTTVQNIIDKKDGSKQQQPETVSIVYEESTGSGASAIIFGVVAFLAVVVMAFVGRWLYNRSLVAEIDQQKKTMAKI